MMRLRPGLLLAASAGAAERPNVTREELAAVERRLDKAVRVLDVDDPYELLGFTRGVYLPGYGVVFTTEVNLVITAITPFHPPLTPAQIERLHQKKVRRLVVMRNVIEQMLLVSAETLERLPAGERVVYGVTLFYRSFEQRDGLPSQIVMQAPRQALLEFKAGRMGRAQFDAALRVQEF
jgi:hypothetical protein